MQLKDAEHLALALMSKHGLRRWTYAVNKRKKALGLCFSKLKRIELSSNFILHNEEEIVRETILHEIAHAKVGTKHGHDAVWKAMAVRVGAAPLRTTRNVVMPLGKWQATCGGCGVVFSRHRRPKYIDSNNCRRCGPEIGLLMYRNINHAVVAHPASKELQVAAHTVEPEPGAKARRKRNSK